jgi:hypothetical protein
LASKDTKVEAQQAPATSGARPRFELRQEIDRFFDRALRE